MIDISNINKYIINLDDRKDRWDHIVQEFKYMDWDYIRFPAINTGDYHGCARSHMAVADIGIKEDLDYLLVCEDDAFFMPYAKEHLQDCLSALDNVEWDMFHLGPIIHRPLNMDRDDCLVDLSNNLPLRVLSDFKSFCLIKSVKEASFSSAIISTDSSL